MSKAGILRQRLGQRIRQLRRAQGWTQQELASRAGVDFKYLGSVERGERNLTIDNVEKIAAGLAVEAHQLFFFSAPPHPETEEKLTEAKIRDLLQHSQPTRKQLMWRLLKEVALWPGE